MRRVPQLSSHFTFVFSWVEDHRFYEDALLSWMMYVIIFDGVRLPILFFLRRDFCDKPHEECPTSLRRLYSTFYSHWQARKQASSASTFQYLSLSLLRNQLKEQRAYIIKECNPQAPFSLNLSINQPTHLLRSIGRSESRSFSKQTKKQDSLSTRSDMITHDSTRL